MGCETVTGARYRRERKYIISEAQLQVLKTRIGCIMSSDLHSHSDGAYLIRSIYFDDLYDSHYQENEDGISPREKWRIRAYDLSRDNIFLECKHKERGLIYKENCRISSDEYDAIIGTACNTGSQDLFIDTFLKSDRPVLNRFVYLLLSTPLVPKVIVEYTRYPYIYTSGNVRITFDIDIASSSDIDCFFDQDIRKRTVMPLGVQLMEVKFDEFLPDHLHEVLSIGELRESTFSKYYLCRRYAL